MKKNIFVKCIALTLSFMLVLQILPGNFCPVNISADGIPADIYLSDMNWESATTPGYGSVQKNLACDGQAATIAGVTYQKAIGTHAINDVNINQDIVYNINGLGYQYFETSVGIKDQSSSNKVLFTILVDGIVKASYTATGMQPARKMTVSVKGAGTLTLRINCTEDLYYNDNSIWAEPLLKGAYPDSICLSDMDWESAVAPGWGTIQKDLSCDGQTAKIAGVSYAKAIGTHAVNDANINQDIVYNIQDDGYVYFSTLVGLQDQNQTNQAQFSILVDGVVKASYTAIGMQPAKRLSVSVKGASKITLRLNCTADMFYNDNSIWAEPVLNKSFPDSMYLSDIDWESVVAPGYGSVRKDLTCDGQPVVVGGTSYPKAIGTHSSFEMVNGKNVNQDIVYDIEDYGYVNFTTLVGLQDQNQTNQVQFVILVDGVARASYLATAMQPAKALSVPIKNAKTLTLRINCAMDGYGFDNAVWASPLLKSTTPVLSVPDIMDLTDLDWARAETGFGSAGRNVNCEGNPLKIGDITYSKGIGSHPYNDSAAADTVYYLDGMNYKFMTVDVGIDEASGTSGNAQFVILGDGNVLASAIVKGSDGPCPLSVAIDGVSELTLRVLNADGSYSCDRSDWGSPKLYKNISMLPSMLAVNRLYDGIRIFDNSMILSGKAAGVSELKVYIDDLLSVTLPVSSLEWQTGISVGTAGNHTIRVDGCKNNEVVMSKSYPVEKVNFNPTKNYTLATKSTDLTIGRMGNRLCVTSLKNPDSGYDWLENISEVSLPDTITVDGQDKSVQWSYKTDSTVTKDGVKTLTIQFTCAQYDLTLDSVWATYPDSDAPVQHSMNMGNNSGKEITVYSVPTLQLDLKGQASEKLELMSITKGASNPDGVGIYTYDVVNGMSKNIYTTAEYNDGNAFDAGYIPFGGIQGDGHGVYIGLEWPQGHILVEGAGQNAGQEFTISSGLNSDFKTDIPNAESYYIPPVFIGCYTGTQDDGSNQMTKWFYNFKMPETNKSDKYPTLQFSYWWSTARTRREWISTDKTFYHTVDLLAKLGFKTGVLDVGWSIADGTFIASPDRWPDGLAKQAQYSHDHGIDFGVYFRPMNGMSSIPGSLTSVPGVGKSEWFVSDASNATIDLGNDEAKAVYKAGLVKLISESNLDVLRTDFGSIVGWSNRINRHKYGVDTTYWTARAFYDVMDDLKEQFPGLSWENCSCGGALKDFMTMQYATRIQSTDTYATVDVRRTFYDASYTFPAMQIMQWFNDFMFVDLPTNDYNYRFRSAIMGSSAYFVQVPDDMKDDELASFTRTTQIYNEWMQPLVKKANIYHVLPRPNGVDWDGMQYFDPDTGKGALLVFKGSTPENSKNVKLAGLDAGKSYHIWFEDKTLPYQIVTGQQLMTTGILFQLNGTYKSEIMYIQEVGKEDAAITAPGTFTAKGSANVTADTALPVTVQWNAASGADSYRVALYEGNSVTPAAEEEVTGTSLTVDGLKAGSTYRWTVIAANEFGTTPMTGNPTILGTGTAYLEKLANLTISGSISETGALKAQDVLYLDSLAIKTNDRVLTANHDVTLTAALDKAAGYKTLAGILALADNKDGEAAVVTLTTDLGVTKTISLQNNDPDRQFVLDISGASLLTITVKNTSKDILTQNNTLLARVADNGNPFAQYYRVLGTAASAKYIFSADVCHDVTGVISDTPRYGIFAGYVDDDNYVGMFLDRQYNLLTTTARVNGVNQGTFHIPLSEGFDHSVYHNLTAYRDGDTFKLYLDGKLMEVRKASIGASKAGLVMNDTIGSYKNMTLETDGIKAAFIPQTPASNTWSGLAPTVVIGKPQMFGEVLDVNDPEPLPMPADPAVQIDRDAVIAEIPASGSSQSISFDNSSDLARFSLFSSNHIDGFSVKDGKLVSKDGGEQKAILKEPASFSNGSVQVDVSLDEAGKMLNGGLYLMANGAADLQDAISGLNVQLESTAGSKSLMVGVHQFSSQNGWLGAVATSSIDNFFADGNAKTTVTLKVTFQNGLMNVYVDGSLLIALMNLDISSFTAGAVGLRSQHSSLRFDNIQVINYDNSGTPEDPGNQNNNNPDNSSTNQYDFSAASQGGDFNFYSSSNGGLEIADGKLCPAGEAGEFKTILKGNRTYKSIQVDIIPGTSGKINSGIYIAASNTGNAVDAIHALGIIVQSDFEGWEDAANRVDLVVGSFPQWTEISRTISETGANNALFTNGVKQALRLKVDIDGDNLTITLSLVSDPNRKIVKKLVYSGASKGSAGLRSYFNDASFDNLSVTYTANTNKNPQTGDQYPLMMLLLLGAATTLILMFRKKKRELPEDEIVA